jgi:hypothetical protein
MQGNDRKRVLGKIKSSAAIKYIMAGFVICVGVWRIYHQTLSYVTGYDPMLVAEVVIDGGALSSPGQTTKLHIYYHDAGASHSGNFTTWITVNSWLTGKKLVAEGVSSYAVRYGKEPFPVEWVDEKTCWITFTNFQSDKLEKRLVKLD